MTPWWMRGVIYQVYPRSFMDASGDGVGDLQGILDRLDHLASLGVDGLWLSPVYPSPNADFGYDIADYVGIDPVMGELDTFDRLVAACRERDLRVVMDLVVNHSSDQHPWFQASRSSRGDPQRDWYIWADPAEGGGPPNNWASTFGGSAWTLDPTTGQYYLHSFLPAQPDLNWRNPQVQDAVLEVMRTWLDRGVSGFRLDVYNCYVKDAALRSNPRTLNPAGLVYGYIGQRHVYDRDQPELLGVLQRMRALVDRYPGAFMVGETLDEGGDYDKAARNYGQGDGLHLVFNFRLLRSRWGARSFGRAIRAWLAALPPGAWPTWVLSNHDFPRQASRHEHGSDDRARLMAVLLLTLRGTPFLYQGEELGMREVRVPRRRIVDPPGRRFWPLYKGRDGCRTPMQWDDSPHAGFSTVEPWLPVHADHVWRNVAAQSRDPRSVLSTYRELLALRSREPVLQVGDMTFPERDDKRLLTWTRHDGHTACQVVLNMTGAPVRTQLEGQVWFSTRGRRAVRGAVELAPYEGLVVASSTDAALGSEAP